MMALYWHSYWHYRHIEHLKLGRPERRALLSHAVSAWSGVGHMLSPGGKGRVKSELYEPKLEDSWLS